MVSTLQLWFSGSSNSFIGLNDLNAYMVNNGFNNDSIYLCDSHWQLLGSNRMRVDGMVSYWHSDYIHVSQGILNGFSDASLMSNFNNSNLTVGSRMQYLDAVKSLNVGNVNNYPSIVKMLVINILHFSKSQNSLDVIREALNVVMYNRSDPQAHVMLNNLLSYYYGYLAYQPGYKMSSITCASVAADILSITYSIVDFSMVETRLNASIWSRYSASAGWILSKVGTAINLFNYPALNYVILGSATTVSSLIIYNMPIRNALTGGVYSWLVKPTLIGGSLIVNHISNSITTTESIPAWLSLINNYFQNNF